MNIKEAREIVNLRKKDDPKYAEAVKACIADDKKFELKVEDVD